MQEILVNLLATVIVGALALLSAIAIKYLNKTVKKAEVEIQSIKDEDTRQLFTSSLNTLNKLIETNVVSVEDTLKQEILKASEDGKLSKDDGVRLKNVVVDNIYNQIKKETLDAIKSQIVDVDSYIENKIETTLSEIKGKYIL